MPSLQLITTLPGHKEPAWCVTFNPTRPILASCSTDKTVRLYSYVLPTASSTSVQTQFYPSPESSKPSFSLLNSVKTTHKRTVRSVAWDPTGKNFATGSFDSTVGIWEEVDDGDQDEQEAGNEGVFTGRDKIRDVEDTDADEEYQITSAKEWECITTLEGHESECKSVAYSNDGALLASCSRDKSVWIWEVQPDGEFECISVLMEHGQDVKCLAWNPHEEILASASYDSQIHLLHDDPDSDWSPFQKLQPRLPATSFTIPTSVITALTPTKEEMEADELIQIPPLIDDETVWSLAWSPCGRYLASGGDLGGIRIYWRSGNQLDSKLVEKVHTVAHSRACFSLSWSDGGNPTSEGGLGLLASAGGDGKIIVWQLSKKIVYELQQDQTQYKGDVEISPVAAVRDAHGVNDVNSVAWCKREDGKGLGMLASCGDDGGVKVWRVVSDV